MSSTTEITTRIRSGAAGAVAVVALAMPGAAFAGTPTDDQYGSQLTQISVGAQPSDPGDPGTGQTSGSLPFTGLDVAAMVAIAAGLGLGGFAMRRQLASSGQSPTR